MFKNMPLEALKRDAGLRENLRLATIGGFQGIDIDIAEAARLSKKFSPSYVKGMLDSFALKPGAWIVPSSLYAKAGASEKDIKMIKGYACAGREIGAFLALAEVDAPASSFVKTPELFTGRLGPVAETLASCGCKLAVSFRAETEYIGASASAFRCGARLCAELKPGNAGVVLDSGSWHLYGCGPEELQKESGAEVLYVRIYDVSAEGSQKKMLPGETGIIDLPAFLNALAKSGYNGPVAPQMPQRDLLILPEEMAVRLLGGSLQRVWRMALEEKAD